MNTSEGDATPVLFTVGYEQATLASLVSRLAEARVLRLVDVRAVANSRRPGFSKRQLAAGLAEAGIEYDHARGLGTPPAGREAARRGRHDELERIYRTQLLTGEAQAELGRLAETVASGTRLCLLCLERQPERCHRQYVVAELESRTGCTTIHLFVD